MRVNSLIERRNSDIYSDYKQIYQEQFLRHQRILEILSAKYYLTPQTLEKIVLKKGKELKKKNG